MTALFQAMVAIMVWSTAAAVGVGVSQRIPPLTFVALICMSATLALTVVNFRRRRKVIHMFRQLPLHAKGLVALFGLMVGSYYVCFYSGLFYAPSVQANVINYLWPLVYAISMLVMFQRSTKSEYYKLCYVLMGFAGAFLLIFDSAGELRIDAFSPWYGASALAAMLAGLYLVVSRYLERYSLDNSFLFLFGLIFVTPFLVAIAIAHDGILWNQINDSILYAIYLGAFVVPVGQIAWANALRLFTSPANVTISFLTPVFSTILIIGIYGTQVSSLGFFGACLVVFSSLLASSSNLYTSAQIAAVIAAILAGIALLFTPPGVQTLAQATTTGYFGAIFSVLAGFTIYRLAERLKDRDSAILDVGKSIRELEQSLESKEHLQNSGLNVLRDEIFRLDAGIGDAEKVFSTYLDLKRAIEASCATKDHLTHREKLKGLRICLDKWLMHYHQRTSPGEIGVIAIVGLLSIASAVALAKKELADALLLCLSAGVIAYIVALIRDYGNHVAERNFLKVRTLYRTFFAEGNVVWPESVLASPYLRHPREPTSVTVKKNSGIEGDQSIGLGQIAQFLLIFFAVGIILSLAIAVERSAMIVTSSIHSL